MDALGISRHLQEELACADPWRLESNPFEQRRHAELVRALASRAPFAHALEVGCAAGAFTERLAPHCGLLEVVDVAPEAIARARGRLSAWPNVVWRVGDVAGTRLRASAFDLIVAAEVLYYSPDWAALERAVDNLAAALAPRGLLLFGSAVDEACERWGLIAGAETTMALLGSRLRETGRTRCRGTNWGEHCLIVAYERGGDT